MKKRIKKLEKQLEDLKRMILLYVNADVKEEWLDSADIKQMFNFSDSKLYRLRKANLIPSTKIGNRCCYPKSYFTLALLEKIKNKGPIE